jgi:diaminobutyrate-2-oxoglutarate transaminase
MRLGQRPARAFVVKYFALSVLLGNGMDIYERYESGVRSYCRDFNKQLVSAEGEYVCTEDGSRYLDFLMGSGALNYGHNDRSMREALIQYISASGIALGLDFHIQSKTEFIEAFSKHILRPRDFDYRIQFTGPTGTNAVEASLRLARKITGRPNVIAFTNAFHGCTLGSLAVTGAARIRTASESQLIHVHRMPYDGYFGDRMDTAEMLGKMLDDPSSGVTNVAAIIVEVIQGEGGINVASKVWAQAIERIARQHGLILIVDEIQTGCGRTGDFFAFEQLGITPDIIVLAKSISGFGLPMAVTLLRPELDQWKPAEHSGTFRGNGLAFVTATVALQKFWANTEFSEDLKRRAVVFQNAVNVIADEFGLQRKGRGFMQALAFPNPLEAEKVKRHCLESGLIVETCGSRGQTIKLLPPLTITVESLRCGLDLLRRSVAATVNCATPALRAG